MNAVLISINLLILIKFLCIIWIETLLLKSQNFVFMSVIWIFFIFAPILLMLHSFSASIFFLSKIYLMKNETIQVLFYN